MIAADKGTMKKFYKENAYLFLDVPKTAEVTTNMKKLWKKKSRHLIKTYKEIQFKQPEEKKKNSPSSESDDNSDVDDHPEGVIYVVLSKLITDLSSQL